MRVGKIFGAALASIGVMLAGGSFFMSPAQADVLIPGGADYYPQSSSTIGGQMMVLSAGNLYGLQKITFGGEEVEIFYQDTLDLTEYGDINGYSYVLLRIPAHKVGTVPIVAYLDPSKEDIPLATLTYDTDVAVTETTVYDVTSVIEGTDGSATSTVYPTETVQTWTDWVETTATLTNSLETSGVVDGLLPVELGDFEYVDPWTEPLYPDHGPASGGTDVVIKGPMVDDATFVDCDGTMGWNTEASLRAQGITLPAAMQARLDSASAAMSSAAPTEVEEERDDWGVDLDVYFDGIPGIDPWVSWPDDEPRPVINVQTPKHAAGTADVTVVFNGIACEPYVPQESDAKAQVNALRQVGEDDVVVARADGFTFVADVSEATATAVDSTPAPAEPTSEEAAPTTSVAFSEGPTNEPSVVPTVTSVSSAPGPALAATGTSSRTASLLVLGLLLLAGGVGVLAWDGSARRLH